MLNRFNILSLDPPSCMSHAIHDLPCPPPCSRTDYICYAQPRECPGCTYKLTNFA